MSMVVCALLLLVVIGVANGQYGCINNIAPGIHSFLCPEFNNLNFTVAVPFQCMQGSGELPCGLIMDVHGWSMNADSEEANSRIREFAANGVNSLKFIVVQPTANGVPLPSWSPNDDYIPVMNFFRHIQTVDEWNIDQNRKHFTGFSQGGSMTWRMLCEWTNEFASAAPSASCSAGGSIFDEPCFENQFSPAAQIPILLTIGDHDPAYEDCVDKADLIIQTWNLTYGQLVSSGEDHEHMRYTSPAGYKFEFLHHTHQAGCALYPAGHCYPGGNDPLGTGFWMEPMGFGLSCPFPDPYKTSFIYGQKILEFFMNNPAS